MYKSLAMIGCLGSLLFAQGCSKPSTPDPSPVASAPAASQPAAAAPAPSAPAPSAPASTAPARPMASGPTGIAGGNSSASDGGEEPANTPPAPARSRPTAAGPGISASSGAPVAGTGRPSAAGPGINPSAGAGPGAPSAPPSAGGPAGLLGNLGNAFASAPPVPEKLTLKDRAIAAFQVGNTSRAYKLLEAYALHVSDEEALDVLKNYRWSSATKRPQLGLSMAVGVTLKNPKNAPAISPIGSEPANAGGGAAGGSSFSRGSPTQGGAKPAGVNASSVTSLAQATGTFSSSFIDEFRKKHDEGVWTEAFKEYSLGTPTRASNSGAGSSMIGFNGGSAFGSGTPGATDGPPEGYAGGGTSQPPTAAGGPPAGYNGGGGGMQPGYGGSSGPPAGYNGGGGGMQPGYGGSSGPPAGYNGGGGGMRPGAGSPSGPPAGYNGGGGGMQPGYGGTSGPPAGYNGGGGGMRPGAGSPSGPPAGYNGGGGGMQPGSPAGGSGAPLQFRRRQGSGLDDGGGPPPPNTPINAVGPGRPGTGLGGAGGVGGDLISMGPDGTLPRGHVPLAPCLTYIGADEANKLIKKAVDDGFDGLFIFEIELDVNRVVGKVINDTRIRVLLPKENVKDTKAIFSCKRLNNLQAAKSVAKGESDGVTDAVELTVKKTEEGFGLQAIPSGLTPEIISTKRIPSLIADKSGSVIDRLSEVNFYYSQGMIDDKQKADAFEGIAGEQGTAIASGTPDDKLEAVEKLLELELR